MKLYKSYNITYDSLNKNITINVHEYYLNKLNLESLLSANDANLAQDNIIKLFAQIEIINMELKDNAYIQKEKETFNKIRNVSIDILNNIYIQKYESIFIDTLLKMNAVKISSDITYEAENFKERSTEIITVLKLNLDFDDYDEDKIARMIRNKINKNDYTEICEIINDENIINNQFNDLCEYLAKTNDIDDFAISINILNIIIEKIKINQNTDEIIDNLITEFSEDMFTPKNEIYNAIKKTKNMLSIITKKINPEFNIDVTVSNVLSIENIEEKIKIFINSSINNEVLFEKLIDYFRENNYNASADDLIEVKRQGYLDMYIDNLKEKLGISRKRKNNE